MYFWAQLNDEQVWSIERIELELNKHPGKRLLVTTTSPAQNVPESVVKANETVPASS